MPRITTTTRIIDGLLDILLVSSLVGTTLIAPNAVQVIGKLFIRTCDQRDRDRQLRTIMHYMRRQGVITITEKGSHYEIRITEKGRQRLVKLDFDNLAIPAPAKWDGRWRIVMFDVPEKQTYGRRALSAKLQEIGFKLMQKSVWVHPFPCLEQIELIKNVYPEIGPYVVLLETDTIDNHNQLIIRFKNLLHPIND